MTRTKRMASTSLQTSLAENPAELPNTREIDPENTTGFADLVITGARIFTLEPATPWASAIALKGEKIVYVGDDDGATALIGADTRHILLSSDVILPAFIDSHTHPVTATQTGPILELPPGAAPQEIIEAVANYAKAHPELSCIKGRAWDIDAFGLEGPNKELLDHAVSDRPVLLLDSSGHSQWLNSKALEQMNVSAATPDPVPNVSVFVRDSDGSPTGWAKEAALWFHTEQLDIPTKLDGENLLGFLTYLRALGVTSVYDAGIELLDVAIRNDEAYEILSRFDREGRLPLRYFGSLVVHSPVQLAGAIDEFKRLRERYSGHRLKFNSVKLFLDGVSEIGTARLLAPYEGQPDNYGLTTISREELDGLLAELHAEQIDFHVHTIGDGAVRLVLDAVEALRERVGEPATQITMAHVELVDPADIHRFKSLGIYVNHTPHWNGGYFRGQERTLGPERAKRTNQLASLIATGAVVALSSDITEGPEWETDRANPYLGIHIGHNRREPGTALDAAAFPPVDEKADLVDLLAGYTINGAMQLRVDDDLGSLTVGKIADFQILDKDIFEVPADEIYKVYPKAVFMDGQLVAGSLAGAE